jgi:hypothetical protein
VVALLICLVLVVVAIVVVFRLLLAELARTAAYRQAQGRGQGQEPGQYEVNRGGAKGPVSPTGARPMARSELVAAGGLPAGPPMYRAPYDPVYADGALGVDEGRPRRHEVAQATQVVWWRRLRSGTALVFLVVLLGVAAAAVVGAVVLFIAFVVERAIS